MNRLCVLAALLCATVASAERPKLLVLELNGAGGVGSDVGAAISEAISQEVARRGYFEPIGAGEIRAILGVERQKQLIGCSEEGSCQAEIAGSLGARFALSGTVAKLGETYQLTLQTLDTQKAQPIARATQLAKSIDDLRAQLPYAVAEATGTPLPAPPSKLLPYSLMGGGGLLLAAGTVVGIQALTTESILTEELNAGSTDPAPLKKLSAYQDQSRSISIQKTASLIAVVAGAAMIGTGAYLYRKDEAGTSIALVPTGNGTALVGVFP